MAIAREDKNSGTLNPMPFSIRAWLFEPREPPRSGEAVSDTFIGAAILAGRRSRSHKQRHDADRNQILHVRLLVTPQFKVIGKCRLRAFPILSIFCLILFGE
ncbi:MAG: hypothetical protein ACRD19_00500 [Terriglobia bacterium]